MSLAFSKKFKAFVVGFMGKYMTHAFAGFHEEWFQILESKRLLVGAPRNFAKSTFFSVFYPLFMGLEGKENIVLISSTAGLAEKFLSRIKYEIETNDLLKKVYGNQVGYPWRNDAIKLKNGTEMFAVGAHGRIRGDRATIIVCDDLENDENVRSADQRAMMEGWFRKAVIGVLNPGQQLILAGTPLHPLSLLNVRIKNPPKGYVTKVYKALSDDGLSSNWPERWSLMELQARREEIGNAAFEQEFMCNPIPDEYRPFRSVSFYDVLPENLTKTITVDPAIAKHHEADYFAIVVVGTDDKGTMYVLDTIHGRFEPDEGIQRIVDACKAHKPHCVGIETVAYQKMLKIYLEKRIIEEKLCIPITELKTSHAPQGKRMRIMALEPYMNQGLIKIHPSQKELANELLDYPTGDHDHLLDALSYQPQIIITPESRRPDRPHPDSVAAYKEYFRDLQDREDRAHRRDWEN